ncbi:hypothetical protein ABW20_dc0108750 [Dactylellina cionopaga]|nr:hypothetical protein ABW20_dc0108750 [Dactylellina cionopaga]
MPPRTPGRPLQGIPEFSDAPSPVGYNHSILACNSSPVSRSGSFLEIPYFPKRPVSSNGSNSGAPPRKRTEIVSSVDVMDSDIENPPGLASSPSAQFLMEQLVVTSPRKITDGPLFYDDDSDVTIDEETYRRGEPVTPRGRSYLERPRPHTIAAPAHHQLVSEEQSDYGPSDSDSETNEDYEPPLRVRPIRTRPIRTRSSSTPAPTVSRVTASRALSRPGNNVGRRSLRSSANPNADMGREGMHEAARNRQERFDLRTSTRNSRARPWQPTNVDLDSASDYNRSQDKNKSKKPQKGPATQRGRKVEVEDISESEFEVSTAPMKPLALRRQRKRQTSDATLLAAIEPLRVQKKPPSRFELIPEELRIDPRNTDEDALKALLFGMVRQILFPKNSRQTRVDGDISLGRDRIVRKIINGIRALYGNDFREIVDEWRSEFKEEMRRLGFRLDVPARHEDEELVDISDLPVRCSCCKRRHPAELSIKFGGTPCNNIRDGELDILLNAPEEDVSKEHKTEKSNAHFNLGR